MRIENSFIPVEGVGETTERKLWRAGVTHWDDFYRDAVGAVDAVGDTTADRIESYLAEARERLDDGDSRFFDRTFPSGDRWRLYRNFRDDACFFDIETTGLSQHTDDVTTVSVHRGGETRTFVNDPDPPVGEPLTRDAVRETIATAPLVVTFNGARFDVPFLEEALAMELDVPHVDLLYPCRRLDLTGGLKRIERAVGIERDRPDISGRDAVRLWRQYEFGGDEHALETLVSYNRADTVNLQTLMEIVANRLHHDVFETACGRSATTDGGASGVGEPGH